MTETTKFLWPDSGLIKRGSTVPLSETSISMKTPQKWPLRPVTKDDATVLGSASTKYRDSKSLLQSM